MFMVRDDQSKYFSLYGTCDITGEKAMNTIIYWCAAFGTHPKAHAGQANTLQERNDLNTFTRERLLVEPKISQHFMIPYMP